MELACTKKLSEAVGSGLPHASPGTDPGQRWFAALVTVNRRKTVFLMHEPTGLCVILYGLKKKDLQSLGAVARDAIREFLLYLGFSRQAVELVAPADDAVELTVAGSVNRKATSLLNRIVADAAYFFPDHLIPHRVQYAVMRCLNQNFPRKMNNYAMTAEVFFGWMEAKLGTSPFSQPGILLRAELVLIDHTAVRELWISPHVTLPGLNDSLLAAFHWNGSHLYEFCRDDTVIFQPPDVFTGFDEEPVHFPFAGEVLKPGEPLTWVYDFGDCWNVRLTVLEQRENLNFYIPVCTRCENPAPPEDCGGVDGYHSFLQVMGNVNHPHYNEVSRWAAARYQPEPSLKEINLRLRE